MADGSRPWACLCPRFGGRSAWDDAGEMLDGVLQYGVQDQDFSYLLIGDRLPKASTTVGCSRIQLITWQLLPSADLHHCKSPIIKLVLGARCLVGGRAPKMVWGGERTRCGGKSRCVSNVRVSPSLAFQRVRTCRGGRGTVLQATAAGLGPPKISGTTEGLSRCQCWSPCNQSLHAIRLLGKQWLRPLNSFSVEPQIAPCPSETKSL